MDFFVEIPDCINESGDMLLSVGDNAVGLGAFSELISFSDVAPFKSEMVCFIVGDSL